MDDSRRLAQAFAESIDEERIRSTRGLARRIKESVAEAAGDLLVRSATALTRLPIGTVNGHVLTVDLTQPLKMKWAAAGGGGAVTSVFTRVGAVVAQAGDYNAAQVGADPAGSAAAAVAVHEAAADPHLGYALESALGNSAARNVGTAAGTVAAGDDGRFADARTPTAHATAHEPGGGDAMAVDAVAGTGSLRTLGTSAQQAAAGDHGHTAAAVGALPVATLQYPVDVTRYYMTIAQYGSIMSAGSGLPNNTYKAHPWRAPRTGTIDQLMIDVRTSVVNANAVVAMWSDNNGAPGSVLCEGTVSCATTGQRTIIVSQAVTVGTLYWFTYLGSHTNVALLTPSNADTVPHYGYAAGATGGGAFIQVAQAYATPAPPWPGGATVQETSVARAGVFVRWAA